MSTFLKNPFTFAFSNASYFFNWTFEQDKSALPDASFRQPVHKAGLVRRQKDDGLPAVSYSGRSTDSMNVIL